MYIITYLLVNVSSLQAEKIVLEMSYHICSNKCPAGRLFIYRLLGRVLVRGGHLLSYIILAMRVDTYSRWALIQSWVFI